MALALVAPLLGAVGADALVVAGVVLALRIGLFAHRFIQRGL